MSKQKIAPQKEKLSKKSKILYVTTGIVILIPLILLVYIYFGAKENSGKPTVGNRFDRSLNPAITPQQVEEVKAALQQEGVEGIEVNLISATLRINMDVVDDANADTITAIMNAAYESVNAILNVDTYFTNNNDTDKMYDLEVQVYNYIPDDQKPAEGQIYMIKTKTAAAKEPNVSIPSTPKNQEVADRLLTEQQEVEAGQ